MSGTSMHVWFYGTNANAFSLNQFDFLLYITSSHIGHMSLHMTNTILGIPVPLLDVFVESDQIGPSIVKLRFKIFLGTGVWVQTVVPEEPLYQRMTNYVFADWWIPTFAITSFLKVHCN